MLPVTSAKSDPDSILVIEDEVVIRMLITDELRTRLGRTSKMGQRDLRQLLIIGAASVVRWASKHGAPEGSWLAKMLAKKPRMLIMVALANKIARTAWALMKGGESYRQPA
jgi:transposase